MITVQQIRKLYPSALKVEQVKTSQLFLVYYVDMVLAVSFETIIAFSYKDEWHLSTEKFSKATLKHAYHIRDLFIIKYWYVTRKEMLEKLKQILEVSESENDNTN